MDSSTITNIASAFFFMDTPTTEIYTLSLHDALPISQIPNQTGASYRPPAHEINQPIIGRSRRRNHHRSARKLDRKSTRLNSSHRCISYAVFCLKKKNPGVVQHDHVGEPTNSLLAVGG